MDGRPEQTSAAPRRTLASMLDRLEAEKRVADALVRVAEEAGGTLALSEVLDRICRLSLEVTRCDRASIYLWSHRRQAYAPAFDRGTPPRILARFKDRVSRPGEIFQEEALRAGEIVVIDRRRPLSAPERQLLDDGETFAVALAPLRARDRPLGSLVLALEHEPGFDDTALTILRGVARQASTLIDNALLFQREEKAGQLRARVAALAASLSAETDAFRIGRLVCAEGASLFRVDSSVLFVRKGDELVACGARPAGSPAESLRVPLHERTLPLVYAFETGEALFQNDVPDPPPSGARLVREFGIKCSLVIPLHGRSGPLGCLTFSDTRRPYCFGEHAMDDARLLSAIATSALERADLFAELHATNAALRRSEEQFRSIIELGSDVITILDREGRISYESPSIERLGYSAEEMRGATPFPFIHPEDVSRVLVALDRVATSPKTAEAVEFRFRHRDGSWRVMEGIGKLSSELGIIVSSRDVTERKRAEEALREEADIAAALARVGQELISSLDAPVILERLCRVTTEVLECDHSTTWLWRAEEGAFVPIAGFVDPPEVWESLRLLKLPLDLIATHVERMSHDDLVELSVEGQSGLLAEILDYYETPIVLCMALRRGSEVIGIQTAARTDRTSTFSSPSRRIARGIAQLASAALANAQLVAELERANRLKSEFVSTMSHELRTPLNVILGFLEMARDPEFTEGDRHDLYDRIDKASRELLDLVEGTLTAGKVEAGRDEARFETVDLAALWAEIGEACAAIPRAAGVALEWSRTVPATSLRTDPSKLRVILRNLVGNAVKFTESGSVRAEIALADGVLSTRISDTGIGIEPADQTTIFEMFRQADGSDSRRFGGTGLGLYIVKRFVTQLGGTISVESALGRGSVFHVRIPVAPSSGATAVSR
jgi:PAS domain S-box-containing protein